MLNISDDKRNHYDMVTVLKLVPKDHLLRNVEKELKLNFVYELDFLAYSALSGNASLK
ncbi:hypothetical protein MUA77_05585 [Mammaliicoccus sciuri]|uniref:hypothetical protein n=1 Tax=Mammaliicoccus sciuri TaxID=1296 RepID=UPI0021D27679|nr:hypothetical protein [Mammaliicoccus sciuri]UXU84861.1 hypothetical protein MUA77_05585 [Mammaliicoccus sciuri]UXU94708.1 hypothetical protein MUA42_05595 [Mammaliicoccus sciuri]UXV16657.1 hypothetical protein MUA89_05590 [Mammaliicoccus sciuri]UXV24917.1 hypothetical protein MUA49_05590 [Mammaliicoccus sciuri]UXV27703.1 hypothetical protein MUA96_05590 [Mammaliicoccus sciuri]